MKKRKAKAAPDPDELDVGDGAPRFVRKLRGRIAKGMTAAAAPEAALARATKKNDGGFDKQALRKEIAKEQRREAKERREKLASAARSARAKRAAESRSSKARCKAARKDVRDTFGKARAARDEARRKRVSIAGACSTEGVSAARAEELAARAKREEELRFQRDMRRIERGNRARAKERSSARERRAESDDEVRANIDPELVPLFNRVRGQIRGGARKSRTEAFLEWLQAHPREVRSLEQDAADDEVERLVSELRAREENPAALAVDPRHGELVSLGFLTGAIVKTARGKKAMRWSLRRAPVLAYHVCRDRGCDVKTKLVIVTRAKSAKGVRPTSAAARAEYARAHWGERGPRPTIPGRVYGGGAVRVLGSLATVTYTTEKGGDGGKLTDYEHAFEGELPRLAVTSDGVFVVLGGSYRVETRGIVG